MERRLQVEIDNGLWEGRVSEGIDGSGRGLNNLRTSGYIATVFSEAHSKKNEGQA